MDTEKMGALIAKMRKEKGLTQKELALQLHVTDRAVSKWERGICCPDISLLEDLANILGVSISSLLNGEEEVESAIKTTITYATESRKQRIKERVNFLFIVVIVFFLLLAISDFVKVEMRFFKKYVGMSCLEYIKNLRLEKAAELLSRGEVSVLEASLSAGFSNLSYFYREFKKKYGVTPKNFASEGTSSLCTNMDC